MAFWNKTPGIEERLCLALERLVVLKEIELAAKGLTIYTNTDEGSEGEISFTDDATLLRMEQEDAIRKQLGLAPNQPIGVIDPDTGLEWTKPAEVASFWQSNAGFGFGVGPEGAESTEPGPPETRLER
jgi:hypothetical protein